MTDRTDVGRAGPASYPFGGHNPAVEKRTVEEPLAGTCRCRPEADEWWGDMEQPASNTQTAVPALVAPLGRPGRLAVVAVCRRPRRLAAAAAPEPVFC